MDLAAWCGYGLFFVCLLLFCFVWFAVLSEFKEVVDYANSLGMGFLVAFICVLFEQLEISYDDLSFFPHLCLSGFGFVLVFVLVDFAFIPCHAFGIFLWFYLVSGAFYVWIFMSYSPNTDNLLGSHNFYPHRYSGLWCFFFVFFSVLFFHFFFFPMAFVNSQSAEFGPWPTQDGLCTLDA
ncbi:hypothetical protein EB50_01397 [Enterococcus faecium]|nr:hypothetical protein EB50_01397 [Enterococcus faecium]